MFSAQKDHLHPHKKGPTWIVPVTLSVAIHGLAVYLFTQGHSPISREKPKPTAVLKSYLYTPPATEPEPQPEPTEVFEANSEPQVSQPSVQKSDSAVSVTEPPIDNEDTPPTPLSSEIKQPLLSKSKPTELPPITGNKDLFRSSAARQLEGIQQQAYQDMLQQETRTYSNKMSEAKTRAAELPVLSEDEKFQQQTAIKANCSGAVNGTLAMLMGFTGANIKCSKPPPIEGFIQKRINKEHSIEKQ